eukprot:TRINITY_DN14196_c0_g1_i1.p1 TRINITY_DN14196_c0_g1~~TRINITY_DN14196_c0_g1_i1.p1  ORF type:complete len:267 (-),score=59.92 TRINITY_DN14196_c0_g1_i1:70-870(-)
MSLKGVVLLKLGGSIITHKDQEYTVRHDKLAQIVTEIKTILQSNPDFKLILGHGAGSFAHIPAKQHGTRNGVQTSSQWLGFSEVRYQAARLNSYVMEALFKAGVPALAFPPSSFMVSTNRTVTSCNLDAMRKALSHGILPVVYGDVAFDEALQGTVLSTEDVFQFLTSQFSPSRVLLAGLEEGVWADFPNRKKLVEEIRKGDYGAVSGSIGESLWTDVTGGMRSKVEEMLELIENNKGLTVLIFSAEKENNLSRALLGERVGTLLL